MNLMSVDIPSVSGIHWGKVALAESAWLIRGTVWLRVLVFLNLETMARAEIPQLVLTRTLRKNLEVKFTWLVGGHLGFGVHYMDSPIRDCKGALRLLALRVGESLDYITPCLRGDVFD